jgi:hypothetical protein
MQHVNTIRRSRFDVAAGRAMVVATTATGTSIPLAEVTSLRVSDPFAGSTIRVGFAVRQEYTVILGPYVAAVTAIIAASLSRTANPIGLRCRACG